jgi:tetratricopeptide (TPR) repeat protein
MGDETANLRVCFMVMPFRRRKVEEPKGADAPAELDCDALWDKAFRPAIEELGYVPIRADYDPGSVIIKDMLERLALADLVLADVSLSNGNVYYEVGLRHAAKETDCVLLAALWSKQLFDIEQFRSVRYPLKDGLVPDSEAEAIRKLVVKQVPKLKNSRTPYYEFVAGSRQELERRGIFRDRAARLSEFQASVREARLVQDKEQRKQRIVALRQRFSGTALEVPDVAIELLYLIRDGLGWADALEFVESLPASTRNLAVVREQHLLALAESGGHQEAIAKLEELVKELGDSPERQGLIGGRYKRLWRDARKARIEKGEQRPSLDERRNLEKALEHYTRGMEFDYNQYYCSCNIPQLLRARGKPGDAKRAGIIDEFVVAACERALARNEGDDWVKPTLLGAAFRAGNVDKAQELAERVALEGSVEWKLKSTLADLADAVMQSEDPELRGALQQIYDDLAQLA